MPIPASTDSRALPLQPPQRRAARAADARQTSLTPAIIKFAVLGATVLALGACSLNSRTAGLESEMITASIAKPVKAEGIDSTDAELIKEVVAKANGSVAATSELAWSNPDTGNRGTIMAIDRFVGNHGQQCKKFQTTVDTFMGISIYNGETCEMRAGFWVLSWFLRDRPQD